MSHEFEPGNRQKLDNEWRRQNLPPYEALQELGLVECDIVADIGCGIGYFSIPEAEIIKYSNKVYALDTSEEMLSEVEKRARLADVKNIVAIKTEEYDLKLPDECVSFSLLVNVLHEIEDKECFINEIKRITKPNGKLAIIEWDKKEMDKGPSLEDRLGKDEAEELLNSAGFWIVKETTFADCFNGIVVEKAVEH